MEDGPTCIHGRPGGAANPGRGESKREHEFYRYYEPIRQMTEHGPAVCNVLDAEARANHKPVSCPDTTLTAFCQLGALRMNARRAMLFFFDVHNAYALAESTKTLSLENDNVHDDEDRLWLGHAMIPRNVACCEITINLPSFPATTDTLDCGPGNAFVVNDLVQDERTNRQPYVTGFPHARFYAGVPIRSPSGINIGAFCILDDKPRQGISEKDLTFLHEMSRNIMRHLEAIRAQTERQRVTRMVAGLGAFVKSSSDPKRATKHEAKASTRLRDLKAGSPLHASFVHDRHIADQSCATNDIEPDGQSSGQTQEAENVQSHSAVPPSPLKFSSTHDSGTSRPHLSSQYSGSFEGSHSSEAESSTESPGSKAVQCRKARSNSRRRQPKPHSLRPTTTQPTYQKAADFMRESLSVDGVVFLDASVGTFGGLADTVGAVDSTETSTCDDSDSALLHLLHPSAESGRPNDKSSKILGCAGINPNGESGWSGEPSFVMLTESFLRILLRRYPHGKIWAFDENGTSYSDDEFSSDNDDLRSRKDDEILYSSDQMRHGQRERRNDGKILQRIFPGARSVALHGIRDARRRRWTAGCLIWGYNPIRVLTTGTEMNLMAAFCDIIAGETRRLEAQKSDKAKSDFISSISHELRSPLHGILGSTEVLRDLELDSTTSALTEQIDSCGRTLLDIIDHLLDFASLKSRRKRKSAVSISQTGLEVSSSESGVLGTTESAKLDPCVSLDDLTEEAVESTVYSFSCRARNSGKTPVPVILDIKRSPGQDWRGHLASGGWKRVCMNLINNALKYTDDGYVHVSLDRREKMDAPRRYEAVLTVTDSGKGMSKEFLENGLFSDFQQEDSFAEGMGLGMNMVGRILHAMGGQISVISDQAAGTRITVNVPLESEPAASTGEITSAHNLGIPIETLAQPSLDIGIIQDALIAHAPGNHQHQHQGTAAALAVASIESACQYMGLRTHKASWGDCQTSSLNFALEAGFTAHVQKMLEAASSRAENSFVKPLIVICNDNTSARKMDEWWRSDIAFLGAVIEFIALPVGIKTISRTVTSVLRRQQDLKLITSMPQQNPPLKELAVRSKRLGDAPQHSNAALPVNEAQSRSNEKETLATPSHELEALLEAQLSPLQARKDDPSIQQIGGDNQYRESDFAAPITSSSTDRPVLLLVDDNKVNLQLLTMYAKKQNYAYITATDGQVAVDAYQKAHQDSFQPVRDESTSAQLYPGRPSVIFMDINMPVMDGYLSTQHIRAYEKKHQLSPAKIVALTALGSDAAHQEAFGSGCDMFLTKPVKLKDLTKIIEDAK